MECFFGCWINILPLLQLALLGLLLLARALGLLSLPLRLQTRLSVTIGSVLFELVLACEAHDFVVDLGELAIDRLLASLADEALLMVIITQSVN